MLDAIVQWVGISLLAFSMSMFAITLHVNLLTHEDD